MAVLLVLVSIAAFFLLSISPIDPLKTNVGQAALGSMSREQVERLEEYWGVNTPVAERFFTWAGDFLRGDMGVSLLYRRPVAEVIGEKLSNSIWLMAAAWLLSGAGGFILGIWPAGSGERCRSICDGVFSCHGEYACILAGDGPADDLCRMAENPADRFKRADRQQRGRSRYWREDRPCGSAGGSLSLTGISNIALQTREKMVEVMESDYVLFARARGDSEASIIFRHGVRNVALPALTLQFAAVSEIFGGSVLVEQVFSYPGLGQAAIAAGLGSDVSLLLGITIISAAIVFAGNTAANLLYGIVDPRIRRGGKAL